MQKLLSALLCVLMLCGCSTNQSNNIDLNQETNPYFIDTEYFTVEVPGFWNGLYEYEIYEDDIGYSLIFYEKDSHASMEAGHLMSISLYLESEDYTYLPSYEELGKLDTGDNIYNVLVEYPTDVQFDEADASKYKKLSNTMESILETITAKEDCVYSEGIH